MRVLHLLSSTGFHGAESMTAELVRQQAAKGVEVHVAAFDSGEPGATDVLDAVQGHAHGTVRIPCRGPLDRHAWRALNRYCQEQRIELVHSHKYKTTFYALPGRLAGSYRLVTTYHNWLTHTRALRLYAALDKALARFNDAAIAVSTPVAQTLRQHMPASRVHQIDNGIDTVRYQRQMPREDAKRALGLDPTRPVIGFVGRLSDEKGLPYLIQALATSSQDFSQVQTLIVGEGEARAAVQAQIDQNGLGNQVQLLGNRRDTPLIYSALDLFVLPSVLEAFPMVLLEAMACGCPVLATEVGEVARIIEPQGTGLIVPPRDPQALARAMVSVLTRPTWSQEMGQQGSLRVAQHFSSDAMAERYLQVYRACLK